MRRTLNTRYHNLLSRAGMGLEYALRRSGPLSMAPSQLGIFAKIRSAPGDAGPRISRAAAVAPTGSASRCTRSTAVTVSVCNLRPESRGTHPHGDRRRLARRRRSGRTTSRPKATGTWRPTRSAMRARLMQHQGHRPLFSRRKFCPGPQFVSDAELARKAGDIATTIFHPVGTCKMGSDPMAVVDAACACTAWPACASSMPRSCRRSSRATPIRR